jgi:iron complex transport system substrate-binding protein
MRRLSILLFALALLLPGVARAESVTDALGRSVEIPEHVSRVICSGPGCLRLLTYLQAQDLIVAVDDIETRRRAFDARPYALANPQFKQYPTFGEFRGFDNPELILSLEKQPQVIIKTYPKMGHDPVELEQKTDIPVVALEYGNLGTHREQLFTSLRTMARVVGRTDRAEEVISFISAAIRDLGGRTSDIPESEKLSTFVGGIAYKGPHGFQSTEPGYPPFVFVNALNVAYDESMLGKSSRQLSVAKEKLLEWDPDVLFLDLSTLQLEGEASGYFELKNDPAYRALTAVAEGRVYGVLPYNWYTKNFGSILADAYFIGKVLYPDRFDDVDPAAKADEIYAFLVGEPVFDKLNGLFRGMAFSRIDTE